MSSILIRIPRFVDGRPVGIETLDDAGIASAAADHDVSKSLYVADPEGNRIEFHVDQSDVWTQDPSALASYKPLTL